MALEAGSWQGETGYSPLSPTEPFQTQLLMFCFRSLNMHLGINYNFFKKRITESIPAIWAPGGQEEQLLWTCHQLGTVGSQDTRHKCTPTLQGKFVFYMFKPISLSGAPEM